MTLGDLIIIGTILLGIVPVVKLLWKSYGPRQVSAVSPKPAPEITSSTRLSAPSELSVSKTDTPKVEPVVVVAPAPRSVSLDTCKLMRAAGLTRDQGRAIAKSMDHTLDNNTWAAAAPPSEDTDLMVNPWSGRQTRKSYYPDAPDLEYKELEA